MATGETKSVCIVGSGNWGSVIAKIIGTNAVNLTNINNEVKMYVFQETIGDRKLTDIINELHENVKYLPGIKLPENVIATPSLIEATKDADILVFVLPHQFIHSTCCTLKGRIKSNAVGISLIKGFHKAAEGGIELISNIISNQLNMPCYVLMGANLAPEIAKENMSEATIGCDKQEIGIILKQLFQAPYFRISVSEDREAVEICGALKNIVACAAGFIDGLGFGDNTKAAAIRLGMLEMIQFTQMLYPNTKVNTFFESCGLADVIASSFGGRNRKVAEALVKSDKSIHEIEEELLKGQKMQGPPTAEEVNFMLKARNLEDKFPIFTLVHRICQRQVNPEEFVNCLQDHPVHR